MARGIPTRMRMVMGRDHVGTCRSIISVGCEVACVCVCVCEGVRAGGGREVSRGRKDGV